jgi:hypothetical protein
LSVRRQKRFVNKICRCGRHRGVLPVRQTPRLRRRFCGTTAPQSIYRPHFHPSPSCRPAEWRNLHR